MSKLKTKEIQWSTDGMEAKIAGFHIGGLCANITHNKFEGLIFFPEQNMISGEVLFDTKGEARQWVEDQFNKFISEVSA